jgi:hypothetical protein
MIRGSIRFSVAGRRRIIKKVKRRKMKRKK